MADEPIPSQPSDTPTGTEVQAAKPVPPGAVKPERNGRASPKTPGTQGLDKSPSELRRFVGWMVGLVIVLVCGWGLLLFVAFYFKRSNWHHPDLAFALLVMLDLGLFLFLEQHFWLSRLMGLRIGPRLRPWQSAVMLWLLGVPGLLFRSTTPVPAAPLRSPPVTEPGAAGAPQGPFPLKFLLSFFGGTRTDRGSPATSTQSAPSPKEPPGDTLREVIETVVFVVVLVLMLRSFVAEAFVIPTGSMAETLFGYQKTVQCLDCGNKFQVNCSKEVDPSDDRPERIRSCTCPYCRLQINFVAFRVTDRTLNVMHDQGMPPDLLLKLSAVRNKDFATKDDLLEELRKTIGAGALRDFEQELKRFVDEVEVTTPHIEEESSKGVVPRQAYMPDPGWNSGDRVLVAKPLYDLYRRSPNRHDVVVFRFPGDDSRDLFPTSGPYRKDTQMNYIKRLIGMSGETIAIHRGKIYVLPPEKSPKWTDYDEAIKDPTKMPVLWRRDHMHVNSSEAEKLWAAPDQFQIVRKDLDALLAMMRPVYDHDFPGKRMPQRWSTPDGGWQASDLDEHNHGFTTAAVAKAPAIEAKPGRELHMLQYQHLCNRKSPARPELITDFLGYNTYSPHHGPSSGQNWVSDLILECEVVVGAQSSGELVLELSKGPDRFQASWDLASPDGLCTLYRITRRPGADDDVPPEKADLPPQKLDAKPTDLRGPGTYRVRFANVDNRLTVWVDGRLPFDTGVTYDPDKREGPVKKNDLDRPAGIGTRGGANLTVRRMKLFRDSYYTAHNGSPDTPDAGETIDFGDPKGWGPLDKLPLLTMYVQPEHYLCLGDNSPESADSRSWGTVPQRLLLGRAVLVYYPFLRGGRIR